MGEARAFYRKLGFQPGYGDGPYDILSRGELVIHLEEQPGLDPATSRYSCYWRVADADALYREFAPTGLFEPGSHRLSEPADEPWGMREFTLRDPSGNLVRVGHNLA